jgi:hypothetical protein
MTGTDSKTVVEKLDALRSELVELAFTLECRRQLAAADVAITTSVRIGELCAELEPEFCQTVRSKGDGL